MRRYQRGFTLLEVMIVIAILGIVAVFAIPSYTSMLERNRLKEAAESLRADMQFARTEAIKQASNILVNKSTGVDGAWCYGMDSDGNCDCTEADDTKPEYCTLKRVLGSQFPKTDLSSTSGNNSFDFRRGTTSSGNTCFSTDKYQLKVVVNNGGKTEVCTGTVKSVPGFETCSSNCP